MDHETKGSLGCQLLPKIITLIAFFALWQLLTMAGAISTEVVHSPMQLMTTGQELVRTGELWYHIFISVKRVLIGFLIASVLGVSSGLVFAASRRASTYLTSLIELLRPIPPIAWIPIAILWFGIGDPPSYFIVTIGAFFPIFVNALNGICSVHPSLVLAAMCLGADRKMLLINVLLPAALPSIMTGLRVGLGIAWTSVIAAELVGAQSGLGYMIQLNRILLQTDKIVVGMISIGVIGSLMNQGMFAIERRWLVWQEVFLNE